jgi:16S rRNA A1518/A1519 N6-dimethyltransferase RsmA/KsgA/DIM1 with predicted DNA glycosylase/AP lyase activity
VGERRSRTARDARRRAYGQNFLSSRGLAATLVREAEVEATDLIMQHEVARKRAGNPRNLLSASWSPWYRFRLGRRIPRTAFRPVPAVDAAVLVVERRGEPLLPPGRRDAFGAFAAACFSGTLVRELDASQWLALFEAYASTRRGT